MRDKRMLYDELCRVLTDYEGNGSEEKATVDDLYSMLVKIQNRWEDVITADSENTPSVESCGVLMGWLNRLGPFECQTGVYHNTLIRVRKNVDFDYLYIQRQYNGTGIKRDDNFEYAGVFCKRNGRIYDAQYKIKDLFDKWDVLQTRDAEVLQKQMEAAVRESVEVAIGNDRDNLQITELSSERDLEKLEQYKNYYSKEQARKAYLNSDDENDEDFNFVYRCDYHAERWTEDSLLAYILDPEGYVNAEAKAYIDSHQEAMLSNFLESDMVAAAYTEIIENPSYPVHRVKRIIRAVSASSAKMVTVTIRKAGKEFTFKAEAHQFRSDCTSHYSDWNIVAADRREFERIFGRSAHYGPEDILRIEYARSVLYEGTVTFGEEAAL